MNITFAERLKYAMKKTILSVIHLLFTRNNPEAVAAGLVDYSGQGRDNN